jgi:hypothetical protein
MARPGRTPTWLDWLREPVGGKTLDAIQEERLAESKKPARDRYVEEQFSLQRDAGEQVAAATTPESKAPAAAEAELGEVHVRCEFAGEGVTPQEDGPSRRAREHLESHHEELQDRCELAVHRSLGDVVRAGTVVVREGGSIEVIVPLVATALTQSPWLEQALGAAVQRIVTVVRRMLGTAAPPLTPSATEGYFAPAPALLKPAAEKEEEEEQEEEPGDKVVGRWLIGAGAFMTATLAVIGITTADLEPLRINNANEISAMFALVVVGILVGVLWPAVRGLINRWHLFVLVPSVLLVGFAVWNVADLAIHSRSAKATPRIDVEVKQDEAGTRLVGTVAADGLKRSEQMRVRVSGISGRADPVVIHDTRAGPTNDGKTEVKLNVPIAIGRFAKLDVNADTDPESGGPARCADEPGDYGCVETTVPLAGRQPKITASWRTSKDEAPVLLVAAHMAGLSRTDKVRLVVRPRRKDGTLGARKFVAVWTSAPDGVLDESIEVAIQPKRAVCVIMRAKRSTKTSPSFTGRPYGPCAATSGAASVLLAPPPPAPAATSG